MGLCCFLETTERSILDTKHSKKIPVKKLLSAKVTCDMEVLMRKIVKREMEAMVSQDFNIHELCFPFSCRKFVIS